uniref:Uncharacterized protein n=1 Tax=Trypanosoma vivax (strain Y486) TaxID=1055687 RepID=G0U9D4_TRYVY|nr:conserved hypothetical protein [Trypanosoma vivax Y486]
MDQKRHKVPSNQKKPPISDEKERWRTLHEYSRRVQQEDWMYGGPAVFFSLQKNTPYTR